MFPAFDAKILNFKSTPPHRAPYQPPTLFFQKFVASWFLFFLGCFEVVVAVVVVVVVVVGEKNSLDLN